MKSIDEHIQKDKSESKRRKPQAMTPRCVTSKSELHSLEEYKEHHPDDSHDPTSLGIALRSQSGR